MKFRNPANNHEEAPSTPWLWTILFGGLYYIAKGLVAPLIIWFVIVIFLYYLFGEPATLFVIILNFIMATLSGSLIRSSYLRKGWQEITLETEQASADTHPCPYCAELVKNAAIKCKHCGSPLPQPEEPEITPLPSEEGLMQQHRITYERGMYRLNGIGYDTLQDAIRDAQDNKAI